MLNTQYSHLKPISMQTANRLGVKHINRAFGFAVLYPCRLSMRTSSFLAVVGFRDRLDSVRATVQSQLHRICYWSFWFSRFPEYITRQLVNVKTATTDAAARARRDRCGRMDDAILFLMIGCGWFGADLRRDGGLRRLLAGELWSSGIDVCTTCYSVWNECKYCEICNSKFFMGNLWTVIIDGSAYYINNFFSDYYENYPAEVFQVISCPY